MNSYRKGLGVSMDENFDFDDIDDVPSAAIADSLNERIRLASANLWRCGAIVLSGDLESCAEVVNTYRWLAAILVYHSNALMSMASAIEDEEDKPE